MSTISTTTQATPFDFPSQTYMDRNPIDGMLWCMVHNSAGNFELFKSINGGTTWTSQLALTRANVQEYSSIYVTTDQVLHWAYRTNESSQDRIYHRKIKLTGSLAWGSELLVANPANGGVAGAYHSGLDLSLDRNGSTEQTFVVIAVGTVVGANHGVTCYGVLVNSAGTASVNNALITGTRQWLHTGSGRITPSIDKEHIGDGKVKGTGQQNLWIAWGRTALRMVKLAWASGKWQGPTSAVQLAAALTPAQDSVSARWDGERFLVVVPNPTAGDLDTVAVYERNRANTATTVRVSPVHPQGTIRNCGVNYDSSTGDMRVYAVGTSTAVLYYVDFVRATGTWTSWAQVLATAILSVNNWGVKASTEEDSRWDVYTAHSGAPNTLTHTRQGQQYPPNIPTWSGAIAPSGSAQNINATLSLDWDFNDPDPNDTQLAYAVSRQIGTGALAYWRASDSTWQVAEVKNTSSSTILNLSSGWGADADANHQYRVKVWDSADTASSYSDAYSVIPSAIVNPSITSPTAAQVLTANSVTVTWTASQQTAYKLTLASGGNTLHDTGWVTSTDLTYTPPVVLADGGAYDLTLETRNNEGLASAVQNRAFTVDFIEPATPTTVATPIPASGIIRVVITNPAPGGGQPALADQDLYRRVTAVADDGIRVASGLASGATYDDWTAVSGVAYQYRVQAFGVNGTSVWGAWTS